jgi:sortase A
VTDPRRFLVVLATGLLLFTGMFVVVLRSTEPAKATVESPLFTNGQGPPTTTTTAPAGESAPKVTAPVRPPADPYVAEPIQEIGKIEIPKIGLVHKVMHGISLRNIDQGPSHWPGTALPGENGNAVFAGHRVTHTHPFRNIDQLVEGDEVFFTIGGVRSRYLVTGHEVVSPGRLDIVNPTTTPTATLFACHPPGSAKQRYVVHLALAGFG